MNELTKLKFHDSRSYNIYRRNKQNQDVQPELPRPDRTKGDPNTPPSTPSQGR